MEYPNNPMLYEVVHHLLFPSPKAAHKHLERICKPKVKATPPPPSLWASLTRRLTPYRPQGYPQTRKQPQPYPNLEIVGPQKREAFTLRQVRPPVEQYKNRWCCCVFVGFFKEG